MIVDKRKKGKGDGRRIGTAAEILPPATPEAVYLELKLALAGELAGVRRSRRLTQQQLAALLKTSQPRVAMMEKGDPSVSLDLLARALLALGVTPRPGKWFGLGVKTTRWCMAPTRGTADGGRTRGAAGQRTIEWLNSARQCRDDVRDRRKNDHSRRRKSGAGGK